MWGLIYLYFIAASILVGIWSLYAFILQLFEMLCSRFHLDGIAKRL